MNDHLRGTETRAALSYVFSTTDPNKLSHRFELIEDYLAEHS